MVSFVCTLLLFVLFVRRLRRLNYGFLGTLKLFAGVWVIIEIMCLVIVYYGGLGFF